MGMANCCEQRPLEQDHQNDKNRKLAQQVKNSYQKQKTLKKKKSKAKQKGNDKKIQQVGWSSLARKPKRYFDEEYETLQVLKTSLKQENRKVINQKNKQIYYAIVYNKKNCDELDYHQQLQMLTKLQCPSIVKIEEHFDEEEQFAIVHEWCAGGTLQDEIESRLKFGRKFEIKELRFLMRQLLGACHKMYLNDIVHCNINPSTVKLVKEGSLLQIRLTDFKYSKEKDYIREKQLSWRYFQFQAPEQIIKYKITPQVDI